jgi:hypothetical protein
MQIAEGDARSRLMKRLRDAEADPAAGPGHEDRVVLEVEHA